MVPGVAGTVVRGRWERAIRKRLLPVRRTFQIRTVTGSAILGIQACSAGDSLRVKRGDRRHGGLVDDDRFARPGCRLSQQQCHQHNTQADKWQEQPQLPW